jgi:hypothetical protein
MKGMDEQRELAPPWIEHPYISWHSNDWTMGPAGFYLWQWEAWFRALGQSARDDYSSKYPEPEGWSGFYEMKSSVKFSDIIRIMKEAAEGDEFSVREFHESASNAGKERVSGDEGLHLMMGRLLIGLLRAASTRQFNEIEIDNSGDECSIHFVRSDKRFWFDALPQRIFDPLKVHVARICSKEGCQGLGTFFASVKGEQTFARPDGEFKVSVDFGDSSLRLTITELPGTTP